MCRARCPRGSGSAAGVRSSRTLTTRLAAAALLLLLCWPARPARAGTGTTPAPEPDGLAEARLAVIAEDPRSACAWSGREGDPSLPVIVPLAPSLARIPDILDPVFACAGERRLGIVLRVLPPRLEAEEASPGRDFAAWLEDLEVFLARNAGSLLAVEVFPGLDPAPASKEWAYVVERVSTLVRSFEVECPVVVGLPPASLDPGWRHGLQARIRPYLDAVSLQEKADMAGLLGAVSEAYPAVPVWVHLSEDRGPGGLLDRIHRLLAGLVGQVSLPPGLSREGARTVSSLITLLPSRYVPDLSPPEMVLEEPAGGAVLGHWTDTLGPEKAVLLPGPEPGAPLRFRTRAGPVSRLRAFDLLTGRELPEIVSQLGESRALVKLAGATGPVLVRYVAGEEGDRADPETVGVTASVELTAAEIIARLRSVEEAQSRGTHHYTSRATLSFHYRAEALNESIDVSSVNRFYWREGVGEYEELELYINGARWRGEPPSLPFVQPEKVKDVPIEIRLDPSYGYRLVGRENLGGRPAYVLEFDPVQSGENLYSGRVWVDAETFTRLRIRLVQQGLEPPITGSEDVIEYGRPPGGSGGHWVPLRGYRQMVLTVLGRSVMVERTVEYTDFVINGDGFEQRREIAYDSGRRIYRDDQEGYGYMIQRPGGGRISQSASLRNVAFFGGVSLGSPVVSSPVAGLNYFDFDWNGTGTQVDVAWAGPFVQAAWTDPTLFGSGWELSAEGSLAGVRRTRKRSTDEERRREEDLEVLEQRFRATLGRPLGDRAKGEVQVILTHGEFDPGDATDERMDLPADLLDTTSLARWRYHREGVSVDLWGSYSWRNGWEDWGYRADPAQLPGTGREGASGSAEDDTYMKWGLSLAKSFYPGAFQKLGLALDLAAGSGLDRFSRFKIGEFGGSRVEGFNGRQLSYDRGVAAEVSWRATLPRGGISLDLSVEAAVIENREDFSDSPEDLASRHPDYREYLVGAGAGVSFNGPWGTLMTVSAGNSVATSLSFSRRDPNLRVIMVKTFGDWPWKKSPVERDPRTAGLPPSGGSSAIDHSEKR